MLVRSGIVDDARVRKEVETLAADGHEITVIGSRPPIEDHPAVPARTRYAFAAETHNERTQSIPYRTVRWWLLPEHRIREEHRFRTKIVELARTEQFDVVHCHDYPTLAAGVEVAKGRPVVYDSHECWSGRLRHGRPEPIRRWRQRRHEARLAQSVAAVLTVGDDLAEWLSANLDIPKPIVVRNSFPLSALDDSPPMSPSGLVYAGRIGPGRDLETAIRASLPPGIALVLAGPVASEFPLPQQGRYEGVMLVDDIPALLITNGLALVSLADSCLNHRLALPNKLFQAVASGVPVVASDLPALRRVVTDYEIGTLYRPGDSVSLARAVQTVVDDYQGYRDNVLAAQEHLTWASDADTLRSLYRTLAV